MDGMIRGKGGAGSGTDLIGLAELATPCLILDLDRMTENVARLRRHLSKFDVSFRPHLKTAKSVHVARRMMTDRSGPATVSTIREAEQFARAGVTDIIYAVGITRDKLPSVVSLIGSGIDIAVILDSVEQAEMVAEASKAAGVRIPALIEIDCDGHRSGVSPLDSERLTGIARALQDHAELRGVLTHAGGSYEARNVEALRRCATIERDSVVSAAACLRQAGFACPVVSVGSTPTAHFSTDLAGVTEVRAGVFVFCDLVMAGLGICRAEDIALSVMATVIGHQRGKGWILIDAGWMALSQDRGTARQATDQGYGIVCDLQGKPYPDLLVADANQEHGIVAIRPGSRAELPGLAIGDRIRILPNHACATGAQHDRYHVVCGTSDRVEAIWPRFRGW